MTATKHRGLVLLPTGPVDWVSVFNANVNILEAGRTLKLEAGEAMTQGLAFYIKAADAKAYLASATTGIDGIWDSGSTPIGTTGLGQTDGIMTNLSWTWSAGAPTIYATASGVLTETPTANVVGRALSATEILIEPGGPLGTHSHTLSDISDINASSAEVNLLDLGGLTVGEVLRATDAAAAAWGPLLWADLDLTVSDIVDLANKSHTSLTDIGVNSHPDIDTFMASGPLPSHIHAETDITDGSLLARVADAEVITGAWRHDNTIWIQKTATEALLVGKDSDGGDIFVVDTTNGVAAFGGVAPVTGCRLVLPQENDSTTPTLSFGDGDSGFFEALNDRIDMALGGTTYWVFTTAAISSNQGANGPSMLSEAPSATNPVLCPRRDDTDTGIGANGADSLSLILGAIEGIRLTKVSSAVILKQQTTTGITAFAGGGQASATQLISSVNVIAICATAGDSVKMPSVGVGIKVIIVNRGAAACDVFPSSGDDLGAGVDTAVSLAVGAAVEYVGLDNTNWQVM